MKKKFIVTSVSWRGKVSQFPIQAESESEANRRADNLLTRMETIIQVKEKENGRKIWTG